MRSMILLACFFSAGFVIFINGCAADDKVIFKCTQTCPTGATVLPDICESSDKSADQIAKAGEQGVADAAGPLAQGCTWGCQKTDSACTQK